MSRSCDYLDFDLGMNSPTSEVYLDIKIFTRSCFLSNINESEPIKIMRFHFCALFSTLRECLFFDRKLPVFRQKSGQNDKNRFIL